MGYYDPVMWRFFSLFVRFLPFLHTVGTLASIWPFVPPFSEVSTGRIVVNDFSFSLNINFNIGEGKNQNESYRTEVCKRVLMDAGCESEYWLHILNPCFSALALGPWTNDLASSSLSFVICTTGIMVMRTDVLDCCVN